MFTRPEGVDDPSTSGVPNIGRDAGAMRRYIIHDKKQFLKNGLGITVNKGDGPNSTILYDELRTTTGKINGAMYKGKKILILKNGRIEYSTDRSIERYVNEFKDLLKKADVEHRRTPAVIVERHTNDDVSQEAMVNIIENVSKRIESEIEVRADLIKSNALLTKDELREFVGVTKISFVDLINQQEGLNEQQGSSLWILMWLRIRLKI